MTFLLDIAAMLCALASGGFCFGAALYAHDARKNMRRVRAVVRQYEHGDSLDYDGAEQIVL